MNSNLYTMRLQPILILLLFCTLFGCDRELAPEPEPVVKDFNFSFRYDPALTRAEEFELIVSQQDGKVVLDTIITAKTQHAFKVKSNETEFNVTTIFKDVETNRFSLKTYMHVNPDKWHIVENFNTQVTKSTGEGEIHFTNIPFDPAVFFETKQSNWTGLSWPNSADNYLVAHYKRLLPNDLAYIMLPHHGKYMFVKVTSGLMNVDFSEANIISKRKFNKPDNVSNFMTYLNGYSEAGDYSERLNLFISDFVPSEDYDIMFPNSIIEEFDLYVDYTDAQGYHHTYNNLSTNVPEAIDFASTSDFKLIKSEFNDFQINFDEDKPSTYRSYWESTNATFDANWFIYQSPEVTAFKPKEILEGLKAKLLVDQPIPAFKLSTLQTQKAKNYTHQAILDYLGNPKARQKKLLRQVRYISKTF